MDITTNTNTRPVSVYSATMIGYQEPNPHHQLLKHQYKDEHKVVSTFIKDIHHSRKLSHMQVNYGNTVDKLSHELKNDTRTLYLTKLKTDYQRPTLKNNKNIHKEKDFMNNMKEHIKKETFINERKRLYNDAQSRKSLAHEVTDLQ